MHEWRNQVAVPFVGAPGRGPVAPRLLDVNDLAPLGQRAADAYAQTDRGALAHVAVDAGGVGDAQPALFLALQEERNARGVQSRPDDLDHLVRQRVEVVGEAVEPLRVRVECMQPFPFALECGGRALRSGQCRPRDAPPQLVRIAGAQDHLLLLDALPGSLQLPLLDGHRYQQRPAVRGIAQLRHRLARLRPERAQLDQRRAGARAFEPRDALEDAAHTAHEHATLLHGGEFFACLAADVEQFQCADHGVEPRWSGCRDVREIGR